MKTKRKPDPATAGQLFETSLFRRLLGCLPHQPEASRRKLVESLGLDILLFDPLILDLPSYPARKVRCIEGRDVIYPRHPLRCLGERLLYIPAERSDHPVTRDDNSPFRFSSHSACKGEAPRPQGGASGKCRYDYRAGFDSTSGVRYRPLRPCLSAGGASSRLAREKGFWILLEDIFFFLNLGEPLFGQRVSVSEGGICPTGSAFDPLTVL